MLTKEDKKLLDEIAERKVYYKDFNEDDLDRVMRHRMKTLSMSNLKKAADYYNRVVSELTSENIHIQNKNVDSELM